jgi:hypothetical protein
VSSGPVADPIATAKAERARRAAMRHGEWMSAVASYKGWYANLERRASEHFGAGTPGHQRRQLPLGPYCYIHSRRGETRAAKARGLCITCYSRLRRQRRDDRYARRYWRYNVVCQHFEKPHHAHGMCRSCYQKTHGQEARVAQRKRHYRRQRERQGKPPPVARRAPAG